MVNKPLIRPYFLGGIALGGVARIPLIKPTHVVFFGTARLPPLDCGHFERINSHVHLEELPSKWVIR